MIKRLASAPAADIAVELECIGAMNIEAVRACWRETRGVNAPRALTRDLLARALGYFLQEEEFGGLAPHLRKLLANVGKNGSSPVRYLKAGSVIVREHEGVVHEVIVVPGGFLWRGQPFSSLSTIALKITGTSWNGPRFFGLRGEAETAPAEESVASVKPHASARSSQSPSVMKFVRRGGRAT
jgi:hypothetical protein